LDAPAPSGRCRHRFRGRAPQFSGANSFAHETRVPVPKGNAVPSAVMSSRLGFMFQSFSASESHSAEPQQNTVSNKLNVSKRSRKQM
ncbi:hypothetical protein TNCV_1722901, partial [Trichonephila clavipes]